MTGGGVSSYDNEDCGTEPLSRLFGVFGVVSSRIILAARRGDFSAGDILFAKVLSSTLLLSVGLRLPRLQMTQTPPLTGARICSF